MHVVLGGTGGIGATIAAWLLEQAGGLIVLVARRPELPACLAGKADRVQLIAADLAAEPASLIADRIEQALSGSAVGLVSVVHAVGTAAGGLISRREAGAASTASAAKLTGALLVEELIARHRPTLALYCSSMSAQLGGIGQVDYAAANGALDGFARYQAGGAESTVRLAVDWDVWRDVGMASDALAGNVRHQAHLAVGLTLPEAKRMLDQALTLQLPQLLISTTDLDQSAAFYEPALGRSEPADGALAEHLAGCLRRWLGVTDLDPTVSLYELGADSLILVDLVAEVSDRTGIELLLSQLSHQVSLAEVLALLGEPPAAQTAATLSAQINPVTVQVWQHGTEPTVVCLLHPIGGDVLAYRPLVAAIDDQLTVGLIADPALSATDQAAAWPIGERARHYYAALQASFPRERWRWRLAGWSFGGWLAVAMAALAEEAGCPADEIFLIDPPSPDAGSRLAQYADGQLAAVFAAELAPADGRTRPEALAYAERLASCGRANLAAMADYRPPALAGTPAQLWLASTPTPGLTEPQSTQTLSRQWLTHLPHLTSWQELATDHAGIVRPPYIELIAAAINAARQPALRVG